MNQRSADKANIDRRCALRLGLGALCLFLPSTAMAATNAIGKRSLSFANLHTGEKLKTTYWVNGAYVPEALGEIDHHLRDFRTGAIHPIDPQLIDLLYDLRAKMQTKTPFDVISGYRSPATNAQLASESRGVARKSFHLRGMAIDISLPDRDLRQLRKAALALRRGGVGYYPKPGFVHVDVGPVRTW
jgi:uncharacterized protein YcbK (DUF882 family)